MFSGRSMVSSFVRLMHAKSTDVSFLTEQRHPRHLWRLLYESRRRRSSNYAEHLHGDADFQVAIS